MRSTRKSLLMLGVAIFGLSVISLFTGSSSAASGINPEISFEGKINTTAGVNIPDGTYNVEFKIYTGCTNNTGTGCTTTWTEDYLDTGTNVGGVTFTSGTFEVNLGSICAFSGGTCELNTNTAINWNTNPLYMSIQIGNNSACAANTTFQTNCGGDGVMSPYILFTATPYAFQATQASNLTNTSGSYTNTLTLAAPTTGSFTITVPNVAANSTVCVVSLNCINNQATVQTSANFDLQGTSSTVTGVLEANGADILDLQNNSTAVVDSFNSSGALTIKNTSTSAEQIDTAAGSAALTVNTTNATTSVDQLSPPSTITAILPPTISTPTTSGTAGSTSYSYEVVAAGPNGSTTYPSPVATLTTGNAIISATNYNVVTWGAVSGATNYYIYRTADGTTATAIGLIGVVPSGTTTLNDTGLTATGIAPTLSGGLSSTSTLYYFEVTTLDGTGGQTIASGQTSATETTTTNNSINLSWAPVTGARGYNVYYSTTSGTYVSGYFTTYTNSYNFATTTGSSAGTIPTTSNAYNDTLGISGNSQLTIGNMTGSASTAQFDVAGNVPSSAIGTVALGSGSTGNDVYVQGSYAYVTSYSSASLDIVNISNPANPVVIGSVYVQYAGGLYVQGNYAYVTNVYADTLQVINVSNPADPVTVGSVTTGTLPISVYVQGNYAYVVNNSGNTLQVINIANPADPIVVGIVSTGAGSTPTDIYLEGNYAYVTNQSTDTLEIFNISKPTSPVLAGSIYSYFPLSVYVQGNYAYVADYGASLLQIVDISNPTNPVAVSNDSLSNFSSVFVQDNVAYVVNKYSNFIQAIDVSNPANPVALASVSTGTGSNPNAVYVKGRYAYVVTQSGTLQIFDMGGAYIQQLQAGGTETGTLEVDSNAAVGGDESVNGGLTVGSSLQVAGSAALGGLTITGITTPASALLVQNITGSPIFTVNTGTNSSIILQQTASNSFPSATNVQTIYFSGAVAVGDSLVLEAGIYGSANITSVTGDGVTWQLAASYNDCILSRPCDAGDLETWYGINSSGATAGSTITVTYSAAPGSGGANGMNVSDWSGISGLDSAASGYTTVPSLPKNTPSLTPSTDGDLVMAAIDFNNPSSPLASPYTTLTSPGDNGTGYYIDPNTTATYGSWPADASANDDTTTAAFIPTTPLTGGTVKISSSTNNTDTFQVQNASGTVVLNVDTTNLQVDIGALSSPSSPSIFQAPTAGITITPHTSGSTTYTYEITSIGSHGTETLASAATSTSLATNTLSSTNYITVSWTAVTGATEYKIYRTANGMTPTNVGLVGSTTSTSFVDNGLTAYGTTPALSTSGSLSTGTTYWYAVSALDDTGGQTPVGVSSSLALTSPNTSLAVTWTPVSGARAYNVYRNTTNSFTSSLPYYTVYTNGFIDTGATPTGTAIPPTTSSAYANNLNDNPLATVTIGNNGTATGQLYVGVSVPTVATGSIITGSSSDACGVAVQGNYAYVTNYLTGNLQIYNVSNPTNPVLISSLAIVGACGVSVNGQYAYVIDYYSSYLMVVNISNPASPVETSSISTNTTPTSLYVSGRYAYITDASSDTLQVFDIANPLHPTLIGSVTTGSYPNDVYVLGSYAYVVDSNGDTLQIFNISNPTDIPAAISTITTGNDPVALYIQGNYAYVVETTPSEMQVLDISNPNTPIIMGSFFTASEPNGIYVEGRTAYIAENTVSVQSVDISNPLNPLGIGTVGSGTGGGGGTPDIITAQGRYVYMLGESSGNNLQIFNLGGAYIQQLQVGGIETSTLQVDSNANVSGDESIASGLTVGESAQISGNASVTGNLTVAGTTQLGGVAELNGVYGGYSSVGLSTPSAPTVTYSGFTGTVGTWSYEVEAIDAAGHTTATSPIGSITSSDNEDLGDYPYQSVTSTAFATPHVTYNVPSGQTLLTGMSISVIGCSGTGADNGIYTITSETTSTVVVSNASGVAGETGCGILVEANSNIISWTPVNGAVNYYVFRTADAVGGSPSTTGFIGSTTGTSLVDNAIAGTATYLAQSTDSTSLFTIGFNSTTNTQQTLFQINSLTTFSEAATCTTSTNQGAMYYNTSTNEVRSCINGSWQDLVSTASFALQLFGVLPNSGNNPGDLIGSSATATNASNTGGPCKVNEDTTAGLVYINSCLAYSGGRLVNVANQTLSIAGMAANSYQNICLNSSSTPALLGTSSTTFGSQSAGNLTLTNATTYGQPLLCLATVLTGSAGVLSKIYDIRTFTTTNKTYATITTLADEGLGTIVSPGTAANSGTVIWPASATAQIQGVIVAASGVAGTNGTPNLIIATSGPQWIAASSGTADDYVVPPATAVGFATGVTTTAPAAFDTVGIDLSTYETSCSAQTYGLTDCQASDFVVLNIH